MLSHSGDGGDFFSHGPPAEPIALVQGQGRRQSGGCVVKHEHTYVCICSLVDSLSRLHLVLLDD